MLNVLRTLPVLLRNVTRWRVAIVIHLLIHMK